MVGNPLEILWIGRATIYEYQEITDPVTFQTTYGLVEVVSDEPCRLSHKQESTVNVTNGAPYIAQTITLIIRPDLVIKEGSVIDIAQHGRVTRYKRASRPAVYTRHQEVLLEVYEDNV